MKVAFISDVHANTAALEAVSAAVEKEAVASVYFLGDAVGYCPFPNEAVALLQKLRVRGVLGNYDDGVGNMRPQCGCLYPNQEQAALGTASLAWTIEHTSEETKAWLRGLPKERAVELENKRLVLFHGSPFDLAEYVREDAPAETFARIQNCKPADVYLFGHTHSPFVKEMDGPLFVNVGSVGKAKRVGFAEYAILEVVGGEVSVRLESVPYDVEAVRTAITASGLPDGIAETWYSSL